MTDKAAVDKVWFVEQFDAIVAAGGANGSVFEKSRDAVVHRYIDGLDSGEFDAYESDRVSETRGLFDRLVKPVRDHRKSSMRKSAEYLIDALNDATVLGNDDPALAQAFPLGNGRDKTLKFWTSDDWRAAATERYRNAAAVTEAARSFDALADLIAAALIRRGVNTTGDLFTD